MGALTPGAPLVSAESAVNNSSGLQNQVTNVRYLSQSRDHRAPLTGA